MAEGETVRRRNALDQFSAQFWVINSIEMIERGAYYGALAITALYMASLGHSEEVIGLLFALLLPLPYAVPLFVGAFAEKYGYKPFLLLGFGFYAAGFLTLGSLTSLPGLLAGILLVGFGAGTFKPIPVSSIAHVTTEQQRNFAYTTFYWGINVGAFLGPLVVGILFQQYALAFFFSAGLIAINFVLAAVAFRNPKPPEPATDAFRALRRLAEVLSDKPFLILLVIYSGFWFMYSMNFSFLPLYLERFVSLPDWFPIALYATINPGTIILMGLPIGKLTERLPSLFMMAIGIGTFVLGFVIIGSASLFPLFVAGMVVATVGEVMTQPGFLSHVSKIAPKDRVAVYQSYGFIPIGLGFVTGPLAGGFLFGSVAVDMGRPTLFWALMAAMGLLTLAAFLLYNHWMARRLPPVPAPAPARRGRFTGPAGALVALLLVPALVGAAFVAGTSPVLRHEEPDGTGDGSLGLTSVSLPAVRGSTPEGEITAESFTVPANASGNVTFTLTWTDENPPGTLPGTANAPDRFRLIVTPPFGDEVSSDPAANPPGREGRIVVTLAPDRGRAPGSYQAIVENQDSGDVTFGPGFPLSQDTGNAWSLEVAYEAPPPGAA